MLKFAALCFLTVGSLAAAPAMRAAVASAPGYLTAQKSVAYGMSGEFEVYDSHTLGLSGGRVSARADLYVFARQTPAAGVQQNYQAFFGVSFNLANLAGLVPFIAFQPGFGLAEVSRSTASLYAYPVLSPAFGLHYFFEGNIHLTANVRYVFGEMAYRDTGSVYFSEGRASLGIGVSW